MAAPPDPARERPVDPPGSDASFCDVVELDLWSPRATFGAHLMVARWPARKVVWYWTAIVEEGHDLVSVVDLTVPLPRRGLELRAGGLWADHIAETPYEHWSVGLEAFAVRIDDPAEAFGAFRGERVPLGYDLEWEHDPATVVELPDGYEQPAVVHGEILLGADTYELDGHGWRRHTWGPRPFPEVARVRGRSAAGDPVRGEGPLSWPATRSGPPGGGELHAVLPEGATVVGWSLARVGHGDDAGAAGAGGADLGRALWRTPDAAGWCHVARRSSGPGVP